MGAQAKQQFPQASDTGVVIGMGKRSLGPQRRLALLGLGSLLAIAAAAVITVFILTHVLGIHRGPALTFTAYGKSTTVSQSAYKALLKQAAADKVSAASAKAGIIQANQDKLAAAHTGLVVSDDDAIQAALVRYNLGDKSRLNDWRLLNGYVTAVEGNLLFAKAGGYEGAVLFFPFNSLLISPVPGYPTPKGYGDPTAIAAATTYAQQQAASYRAQLVNGKINLAAALAAVQKNTKLQFAGSANDSYSFVVDTQGHAYLNGQNVVSTIPDFVVAAVHDLAKPGVSDVKTMTNDYQNTYLAPGVTSPTDVAYYFVDVTKINSAQPNIQTDFTAALKDIKVTDNVK